MSAEPLIGEIMPWAPNFAPRGWAFCDGQLLSTTQYSTLYSLLGTMYGGDGLNTFGLPDLRGRAPIGAGHGPNLSSYIQGQKGGLETVTLNQQEMPAHNHSATPGGDMAATVRASTTEGSSASPSAGASLGTSAPEKRGGPLTVIYTTAAADTDLGPAPVSGSIAVSMAGGGTAHENRMPFEVIQYCIALEGVYPSRG